MSDCYLTPREQFFSHIMTTKSTFQLNEMMMMSALYQINTLGLLQCQLTETTVCGNTYRFTRSQHSHSASTTYQSSFSLLNNASLIKIRSLTIFFCGDKITVSVSPFKNKIRCNDACLAQKQQIPNFIVYGLTRPGLEPTIYHTQREHTNHYHGCCLNA